MTKLYTDLSEIEAVVTGFEKCTTDKGDFRHGDHLTIAVCYLAQDPPAQAVSKMRSALFRFIDYHGVPRQKYHETLTVFWIELTSATLARQPNLKSLVDKCNYVRSELANKDIVEEFYSKELIDSERARREFVEPDLKHLAS